MTTAHLQGAFEPPQASQAQANKQMTAVHYAEALAPAALTVAPPATGQPAQPASDASQSKGKCALPAKETVDLIQFWSSVAAILVLPIGIWALFYAGRQLSLARKAGSGSSLIALSEAFPVMLGCFPKCRDEKSRHIVFGC
jgi:hypothetical protein